MSNPNEKLIHANLPYSVPSEISGQPAWERLEEQRRWYSSESGRNKRYYQSIKITQIVLASAIPVVALFQFPYASSTTAVAGSVIAVLEAIQQLKQYSQLWIEYRSTTERLKREKYLFLAEAGPYRDMDMKSRLRLLAERIEDNVFTEHERWMAGAQKVLSQKPDANKPGLNP